MKLANKLSKWLNRSSSPKRAQKINRAVRNFMEPLEDRQMLSLLGVAPLYPDIFIATGTMNYTYNSSTGPNPLTASGTPQSVTFTQGGSPIVVFPGVDGAAFNINVNLNGTGGVIPGQGTVNPNLVISGKITDPNTHAMDDGVLIQGKIVAFGSQAGAAGSAVSNFDFDFAVTGGLLANYFANSDIGVSFFSQGNTFTGAFNTSWSGGNGLAGVDGNVGPIPPSVPQFTPGISIVKTASCSTICPGQADTYTYTVTNTGNQILTNIIVTDDNGTPNYTGDDFTVGTIATLAPGASTTLTAVVIPVVTESTTVNGTTYTAGQLIAQIQNNGNVAVTYLQNQAVYDNTYGTGAVGWGSAGHSFAQMVSGDNAEFNFTNKLGQTVFDFNLDYISQDSADPSGYGSLGVSGGDGQVNVGKASWIVSYDTSITDDVNNPAFLPVSTSGVLVNSPVNNANWNYVSSYSVVVSAAAFGSSGFGGVTVPCVEDSPSKIANNCSCNNNYNNNNCAAYANFCNSNCFDNLCDGNGNNNCYNNVKGNCYAGGYSTWYNNCYNNSCNTSNTCNGYNYCNNNSCNNNSYCGGYTCSSGNNNGNGNYCNSGWNANCSSNCNYNTCNSACYDNGCNSNYGGGSCCGYGNNCNNNCTSNCCCNLCLVPTASTVTNTATVTASAGNVVVTATGTATIQIVPCTNMGNCNGQFDCCCWSNSSCENCFDCGSYQNFGCGGNYNWGCGSNQYNNNCGSNQNFFCGGNNYWYSSCYQSCGGYSCGGWGC